jgi:hypothetical protein
MKHRKLRIAISVLSGIAGVLFVALWVRSYSVNEVKAFTIAGTRFHAQSLLGRVMIGKASNAVSSRQPVTDGLRKSAHKRRHWLGFSHYRAPPAGPKEYLINVRIPHWFLVMIFAVTAILPWTRLIRMHFSLRTLLIAVTIVAIVLGLIFAAKR